MSYDFHKDKRMYFRHQYWNAERYVLPFIEEAYPLGNVQNVLEIGCGEGGVLKAFLERGIKGVGVELSQSKLANAQEFLGEYIERGRVEILGNNIFDISIKKRFSGKFDLIVLKDVIEHIYDKPRLFLLMKELMTDKGHVFIGFPPWQMPFGGHQQICDHQLAKKLPFFHLLPRKWYRKILKSFGESEVKIDNLLEIRDTRITIESFSNLCKSIGYDIVSQRDYLVNPIYRYKFKLRPVRQISLISAIPYLRNYLTTCVYTLVKPL